MRQAQQLVSPGWVAGSVRARHLLARRLGREQAGLISRCGSLEGALAHLAASAYGRFVRPGMDLAAAQRAVADTTLWHLRVLAGWMPPHGVEPLRALSAWFELANIEDRLAYLEGGEVPAPFVLGGLATAWPRLGGVQTGAEMRAVLAGTAWGDPGTDDPAELALALRFAWARRVLGGVDEATEWAAGAVALLVARELLLAGRPASDLARRPPGIGSAWREATSLPALRAALPAQAYWVLDGVEDPSELWRGEAAWWRRVEADALRMSRAQLGRRAVVGSVVLLGVDAWRVGGALEAAARGSGPGLTEVFEEIA